MLGALAGDHDYDVRSAVAGHASTPTSALSALAVDSHVNVRRAIVNRPDVAVASLRVLAFDDDDEVRLAALAHTRLDPVTRNLDEALMVGRTLDRDAVERLYATSTMARRALARHRATPPMVLRRLARDGSWLVRDDVARHPRATEAILRRLSSDGDRDIRATVAQHRRTSPAVLTTLMRDSDERVQRAALANPSLPLAVRHAYVEVLRRRALRSDDELLRAVAVAGGSLSPGEQRHARRLHASHWIERIALAHAPNATVTTLLSLARDGHRSVRKAARDAVERVELQRPGPPSLDIAWRTDRAESDRPA